MANNGRETASSLKCSNDFGATMPETTERIFILSNWIPSGLLPCTAPRVPPGLIAGRLYLGFVCSRPQQPGTAVVCCRVIRWPRMHASAPSPVRERRRTDAGLWRTGMQRGMQHRWRVIVGGFPSVERDTAAVLTPDPSALAGRLPGLLRAALPPRDSYFRRHRFLL